tara:strand:- start:138 stop:308 length:171 start_codon:yes stop_codon:yes gene_type:complete
METMVAILMLIMVICFAIVVKLMQDKIDREQLSADRWRDTALLQQRMKYKLKELTR